MSGTRQHFSDAACQAEFLLIVSGSRHNFLYPSQSLYLDHDVWNQTTFH